MDLIADTKITHSWLFLTLTIQISKNYRNIYSSESCECLRSPFWGLALIFWMSLGLNPDIDRKTVTLSFLLLFLHSGTVTQQIECVSPSLLPVSRGSVALLGLGLSGGRCCMLRSCVVVLFLLALDRLSSVFRPVSGSLWMNFFSTYLERIHDSLSPLRHTTHSLSLVKNTQIHFCEMGLLVCHISCFK